MTTNALPDLLPVMGFDPGLTGAFAIIAHDGVLLQDYPVMNKEIHAPELARLIRTHRPRHAIIEIVGSMPKQGVASTFTFGRAYGTVLGILGALEIPCTRTSPSQWKKFFHLTGKPKDAARALAVRLYPGVTDLSRKMDHNRADALLLARYLIETRKFV